MLGASGDGAALVAGASAPAASRTERVAVVRPFLINGERVEAGAVLDLPWRFARELATYGKVEPAPAPVEPAEPVGARARNA